MRGAQSTTAAAAAVAAAVGVMTSLLILIRRRSKMKNKKGRTPKVILITGASSGIGKATALQLLAEGHIVYGAARRIELMKDIQAEWPSRGHVLEMDVCDQSQITAGVQKILKEQNGRIDVLINNAGYPLIGPVELVSIEEARQQFEVNLFGLAAVTKAVIPAMRNKQQSGGTIINMSSLAGKVYSAYGAWYYASKHALEGWSDCCRLDLKEFGIHVVIVEPGFINTGIAEPSMKALSEQSRGTAYERSVENCLKWGKKMVHSGSDVSVMANVLSEVVHAESPKRRYVAGASIRQLFFLRNWFGDAVFDAIMLSALK